MFKRVSNVGTVTSMSKAADLLIEVFRFQTLFPSFILGLMDHEIQEVKTINFRLAGNHCNFRQISTAMCAEDLP